MKILQGLLLVGVCFAFLGGCCSNQGSCNNLTTVGCCSTCDYCSSNQNMWY